MADIFWPKKRPSTRYMHGWLGYGNKEELKRVMDNPNVNIICELGTWYGKSADFMMNYRDDKLLICVDLWSNNDIKNGNQVIKYNDKYGSILDNYPLYETFLGNLWEFKKRIIPLKMDTKKALRKIKKMGIVPDAIYIDANHTYKDVKSEIELSLSLFPDVILLGDDINWKGVKRAVIECANIYGFHVIKNRNCWRFMKKVTNDILENKNIKII